MVPEHLCRFNEKALNYLTGIAEHLASKLLNPESRHELDSTRTASKALSEDFGKMWKEKFLP